LGREGKREREREVKNKKEGKTSNAPNPPPNTTKERILPPLSRTNILCMQHEKFRERRETEKSEQVKFWSTRSFVDVAISRGENIICGDKKKDEKLLSHTHTRF
jgi:hypothetical protein